jgi:hypothetical protein
MMLGCCKYPYALYQVFGARETQREILISNFKWRTNFNNFTMHVDKFDDFIKKFPRISAHVMGGTAPGARTHISVSRNYVKRQRFNW